MTDGELLRHYAQDGSEAAFEEFVGRYLALVEGIARRKTRRESLVNEVSMQVFASVATKAAQLMARDSLGAWLVVATRFAARDALRKERTQERHRRSIMEASSQEPPSTGPQEDSWNELGPLLDDALATLPEGEREAVVLYFYRRLPYREVGVRLGRGEDAARKRVGRALERLSLYFRKRGVSTSATIIASGLSLQLMGNSSTAAAARVSQRALETAATSPPPLLFPTLIIMNPIKASILLTVACVALSAGGGYLLGQRQGVASVMNSTTAPLREVDPTPNESLLVTGNPGETRLQALARDLINAQQLASKRPSERYQVEQLIESVRTGEFAPLVRLVKDYPNLDAEWKFPLHCDLVRAWASTDGAAALNACVSEPAKFRWGLLDLSIRAWALTEPELAQDWLEHHSSGVDENIRNALAGPLFAGWAVSDPAQAAAYVETLPYDQFRKVPGKISELADREDRVAFVNAAALVADERFRGRTMEDLIRSALYPDLLKESFDTLALLDPDTRWNAAIGLVNRLYGEAPKEGAEWLWSRVGEDQGERVVREYINEKWAKEDPAAAAEWLENKGL